MKYVFYSTIEARVIAIYCTQRKINYKTSDSYCNLLEFPNEEDVLVLKLIFGKYFQNSKCVL